MHVWWEQALKLKKFSLGIGFHNEKKNRSKVVCSVILCSVTPMQGGTFQQGHLSLQQPYYLQLLTSCTSSYSILLFDVIIPLYPGYASFMDVYNTTCKPQIAIKSW